MAKVVNSKHKIASMTVFCNEAFRIDAWKRYYSEYRDYIDTHVIINNGNSSDSKLLHDSFPDSVVLECDTPNLLRAYNIGLDYIINNTDVDSVLQVTNDVRFERGAIDTMLELLFSDSIIGAVGPTLLKKDSSIIESFGWILKGRTGFGYPLYSNCEISYGSDGEPARISCGRRGDCAEEYLPVKQTVTFIPAGVILVKLEAWKKVGKQDELLCMYQDERDFAIRLSKEGYIEVASGQARAWHQHQYKPGCSSRALSATYYSNRNKIYVTRKHYGKFLAFGEFFYWWWYNILLIISHIFRAKFKSLPYDIAALKGYCDGIRGKMMEKPSA